MSTATAIVLAALGPSGTPPAVPEIEATTQVGEAEPDPAARAGTLFRDGEFAEAAAAFLLAYERTGDPAFLFGRAQALRRAGNCGAAIDVFETFIATEPPEADIRAARDVIEACRSILGQGAVAPLEGEAVPEPDEPDEPPRPRPAWPRDVTGGVLLGSGIAIAIAGGVVYGSGASQAGARMETEQAYEAREQRVRVLGATGVSLMVSGGALLVGSVVRYVIVARRQRAQGGRAVARRWAWPPRG